VRQEQRRIAAYLDDLQGKVNALKVLQALSVMPLSARDARLKSAGMMRA
jgi:hypothetical protein